MIAAGPVALIAGLEVSNRPGSRLRKASHKSRLCWDSSMMVLTPVNMKPRRKEISAEKLLTENNTIN